MLFLFTAGAIVFFAAACAPRRAFKPVASVKQLMEATIQPSSEVLFESVGTIVSSSGVEEIAPKNDEEWATVRHNALTLAESGNLLMIGPRARDKGEWTKMSPALVDAGVAALKAAEAKNPEALFEAGGQVYDACQQCHSQYWNRTAAASSQCPSRPPPVDNRRPPHSEIPYESNPPPQRAFTRRVFDCIRIAAYIRCSIQLTQISRERNLPHETHEPQRGPGDRTKELYKKSDPFIRSNTAKFLVDIFLNPSILCCKPIGAHQASGESSSQSSRRPRCL